MRSILVDTLYTQPSSLALGAMCGIVCSLVAAFEARSIVISTTATLLAVVAVFRVAMAISMANSNSGTRLRETFYEIGAFSYSLLAGLIAAEAIWLEVETQVQTLLVANAIAYGVGIAARNAGRPMMAMGQLFLAEIPVIVVAFASNNLAMVVLASVMLLLLPAMMSISLNVFKVLRDSIAAAETSARLAERMQELARTDVVTNLHNRAGLNHYMAEQVRQLGPADKLALFWVDLDRFKEVNDTLGHQAGDRVLAEVALRLRAIAPDQAIIGRFGGDEFVLASVVPDRQTAERLAHEVLADIIRPFEFANEMLEVGSSLGIALLPDDGSDLETIMQAADLALYHAKVNGRKQVSFFDSSMTRNLVRRREIESELRLALQREELSIFFQPIVDLATGKIRAFEALVRWFHPEKGELYPDEFIPVAEETGAIITLGNWITLQAAKAAASWPDDVTVAVNLSPLQIKAPGAALGILNALREAGLPGHRLELEVTETVLIDHSAQTANFMQELARAGVKFALDDFGTGYSSLGYLNKYPFGKIKIDRSFVSGENAGARSDAIIRAVSGMAATLGMEIVAEGLETVEQVGTVREAGCTLGQGYYFSRAVPDYLAGMLLAQERERLGLDRAVA